MVQSRQAEEIVQTAEQLLLSSEMCIFKATVILMCTHWQVVTVALRPIT